MIDTKRLKDLLQSHDVSQSQLADELGISPSAVHQIVSGKTKESRHERRIAEIFDVTEAYLRGETDNPFRPTTGSMTPLELAKQLRIAMSGSSIFGNDGEGYDTLNAIFDPHWLCELISKFDMKAVKEFGDDNGPPVGTINASTDAMAPTIMKGDDVTYSLATREVKVPDAIWALDYGGLRMIRRLMPLPNGGFRVSADNPASPTFEAPAEDIRVLGRAFWIGRSLVG